MCFTNSDAQSVYEEAALDLVLYCRHVLTCNTKCTCYHRDVYTVVTLDDILVLMNLYL